MAKLVGREVQQHMSAGETCFHALAIFCTLGMWYPIYRSRKRRIERVTNIYT